MTAATPPMPPETVSVVIPVRNGIPFVGDAIRSALAQDHPAIEVLVVDDASTDGTADWVSAQFGDRLRLIRLGTRHHLAGARNVGLAHAHGDYLQFLDADDTLPPSKVRAQLACFRRRPTLAVAVARTVEDGSWRHRRARRLPASTADVLRPSMLRGNFISVHAALCRTEAIRAVGGFNTALTRCEDYDLWLRLIEANATFEMTPDVAVTYRRTAGSLSSNHRAQIVANWHVLAVAARRCPPAGRSERMAFHLHRASLVVRFAGTLLR